MRMPADWMAYADERIMEFLAENGNHQPGAITEKLGLIGGDLDFHPGYIGRRCRTLAEYGLLQNVGGGVYSITDEGLAYLAGELDASELSQTT